MWTFLQPLSDWVEMLVIWGAVLLIFYYLAHEEEEEPEMMTYPVELAIKEAIEALEADDQGGLRV